MKKLVISRNQQGEIVEDYIDMTPEEIAELPEQEEPQPISYPTAQIVADRVTGQPYEVFVENGVLTSEPLGDSNG